MIYVYLKHFSPADSVACCFGVVHQFGVLIHFFSWWQPAQEKKKFALIAPRFSSTVATACNIFPFRKNDFLSSLEFMFIYRDNKSESSKIKPDDIKGFNCRPACNWGWVIVHEHSATVNTDTLTLRAGSFFPQMNWAFSWFLLTLKSKKDALIIRCLTLELKSHVTVWYVVSE